MLDGVLYVLRTGCQWKAVPREFGAGSTIHRRFQRWVDAGCFEAIWKRLLQDSDLDVGLDWRWQSADASLHKAPLDGGKTGPNPTERAKSGTKRHHLTDGAGIPISVALTAANRPDKESIGALLDARIVRAAAHVRTESVSRPDASGRKASRIASAFFTPSGPPMTRPDEAPNGHFSWHELMANDPEAAFRFYSQLFGWEKTEAVPSPTGVYQMYGKGGRTFGGMIKRPKDFSALPHWLYYVKVGDLDGALRRVKHGGGQVMNGPMEVPGGARVAQCTDPQRAAFALHGK